MSTIIVKVETDRVGYIADPFADTLYTGGYDDQGRFVPPMEMATAIWHFKDMAQAQRAILESPWVEPFNGITPRFEFIEMHTQPDEWTYGV